MKRNYSLSNIFAYLQGNLRYFLYYRCKCLIRKHILEQIDARIKSMKKECYSSGSCIMCGCATTMLQMADRACEGGCYPVMLDKKKWRRISNMHNIRINNQLWRLDKGLFKKV